MRSEEITQRMRTLLDAALARRNADISGEEYERLLALHRLDCPDSALAITSIHN